jgi:hypothetical protein
MWKSRRKPEPAQFGEHPLYLSRRKRRSKQTSSGASM